MSQTQEALLQVEVQVRQVTQTVLIVQLPLDQVKLNLHLREVVILQVAGQLTRHLQVLLQVTRHLQVHQALLAHIQAEAVLAVDQEAQVAQVAALQVEEDKIIN